MRKFTLIVCILFISLQLMGATKMSDFTNSDVPTAGMFIPVFQTGVNWKTNILDIVSNNYLVTSNKSYQIGIGIDTPLTRLHLYDGASGVDAAIADGYLLVENDGDSFINIVAPTANTVGIKMGRADSQQRAQITYGNTNELLTLIADSGGTNTTLQIDGSNDIINFTAGRIKMPTTATPGAAATGNCFVRSDDGKLRCYDGSNWNDCW